VSENPEIKQKMDGRTDQKVMGHVLQPVDALEHRTKAQLQILEADVNRQVEEEFQQGGRGLPRDTLPMMQTLAEQVLQWPLATRQQWLDSLEAAWH